MKFPMRKKQFGLTPAPGVLREAPGSLLRHALALGFLIFQVFNRPAAAQTTFNDRRLVSDIPGVAEVTDPNLVNPWGLAFSGSSPFWISDNHSGLSTIYNGNGGVLSLIVSVPPPAGAEPPAAPSGIVYNGANGFLVGSNAPARFIFSTEDGTISGWNSGTNAVLKVDNSVSGTVYKGLALGTNGTNIYLYATDFHHGHVDVFDSNYNPVDLPGAFVDPEIAPGFAPFGIENLDGLIFITYAVQDSVQHDDVSGPGNGYVSIFRTDGAFVQRFATSNALNSPWGLAKAPSGFGDFSNDILIANFGSGEVHAYDTNGVWQGQINHADGTPFAVAGLWGIKFGNGANGSDAKTLYYTAGIPGGGSVEDHGLFGALSVTYPVNSYLVHNLVSDIPGLADNTDTNLVNPWGIATSPTSPFWISDNHSGFSTLYNTAGTPLSLIVNVPPPEGGTPPAAPSGIIYNGTSGFTVASNAPAHFIFSTEDGTISGWSGGTNAVLMVDHSADGTVYKGLAAGRVGTNNYIYATDFHHGKIDVYDENYNLTSLAGAFADPSIPVGFAPFGIANLSGSLYVTYAVQDDVQHDDVSGPGNGFVNVFTTSGTLIERFATSNVLNSPWGLAQAPAGFGPFSDAILVANFGDGVINAFDASTREWLGHLNNPDGSPFAVAGLWGIAFGNGASGGNADTLYFTAGIPAGGNVEDHGLFGSIKAVYPTLTSESADGLGISLTWGGGQPPYLVQELFNLTAGGWTDIVVTSNQNVTLAREAGTGYYRVAGGSTNEPLAFTASLDGISEVPSTSSAASGSATLTIEGTNLVYSVGFTGLSSGITSLTINGPATPTSNGAILVNLPGIAGTNTAVRGTAGLLPPVLTAIRSGMAYLNVTTAGNSSGEIRGQIVPLELQVSLNGASEAPPVQSAATVTAILRFIGREMHYQLTYSGLGSAASSVELDGPAGVNVTASTLLNLNPPTGTSGKISGLSILTPAQLADLLAGQTYLNIRTGINGAGEIRGQVIIPN